MILYMTEEVNMTLEFYIKDGKTDCNEFALSKFGV